MKDEINLKLPFIYTFDNNNIPVMTVCNLPRVFTTVTLHADHDVKMHEEDGSLFHRF